MNVMDIIYEKAKANPQLVAFPEVEEEKILLAARECLDKSICKPVLVGKKTEIFNYAKEYQIDLTGIQIVDCEEEERIDSLIEKYTKENPINSAKSMKRKSKDSLYVALMLEALGEVDATFAGLSHTTGDVIMAGEMVVGLQAGVSTVSSVGIANIPGYNGQEGELLLIGDSAVCANPTEEDLGSIAISACDTAKNLLGWDPRCALVSFSTTGSAEHELIDKVKNAVQIANKIRPDYKIDGEFQLDAAISPAVAAKKVTRPSEVAGKANIIIWPDLNVGNIAVKLLQQFAHADVYGPILQGFKRVVCDCSRSAPISELVGILRYLQYERREVKMKIYKIFTINPGSTSTKIALFEGEKVIFSANVNHDAKKLAEFKDISEQLPYRKETILTLLKENHITLENVDAFVGRGGGLLALPGGTYEIDHVLLEHASIGANGVSHPAQLGSQLAHEFCLQYGGREFVVNPPDVDEYEDIARVTGIKEINRTSHIHSLNQKETAIRHAWSLGKTYEECNFIVCHIGGGISIAAHKNGKMIDGTDVVEGEGPMAPTRSGAIPSASLIRMCFSGKYTEKEMLEKCTKSGGMIDLIGTADTLEISNRALQGERYAKLIWNAMIYQINKSIGAMAAVLHGNVDGILLGGGMVFNQDLVIQITEACSFIATVSSYPGEFEMEAMASGAIRVLEQREIAKKYTGVAIWSGFDPYFQ